MTNDGSHTYQYDAENRLIKIDGGSTAQYAYGPQGERVSKIAAGVTTYFYWGIGEKISGQWTKLYVQGLGGKLVEYSGGTTWFFATNHLGTIAARMNVSGQLMETYRYLLYGERYAGTPTPHQYTGKERDAESGLDYFGARYYASAHGRWMGVDPVLQAGDPQLLNRYAYVRNEPINKIDPTGKNPLDITAYQMAAMLAWIQSMIPNGASATPSGPPPETVTVVGTLPAEEFVDFNFGGQVPGGPGSTAQSGNPGGQGGGGSHGSSSSSGSETNCPPVPLHPSNADVDRNIREAEIVRVLSMLIAPAYGITTSGWFVGRVAPTMSWDYKRDGNVQFAPFGNFNYGATGAALGLPLRGLQMMGGLVAEAVGTHREEWGRFYETPYFGHDPADVQSITEGYTYYQNGCASHEP